MSLLLLVGDQGQGKTTACRLISERVARTGATVGGILQPASYHAKTCIGYDVLDLASGRSVPLAGVDADGVAQIGRFSFFADGLAFGKAALDQALDAQLRLVVVDEVGPLELAGGGWSRQMDRVPNRAGPTLISVRRTLADQAAARWGPTRAGIAGSPTVARFDLNSGQAHVVAAIMAAVGLVLDGW